MPPRSRRVSLLFQARVALAIAFCAFFGYAGYTITLAARHQAQWQRLSSYDMSFVLDQARIEALRLHNAILAFRFGQAPASSVSLAFDILANRAQVITSGPSYASIQAIDAARDGAQHLLAFISRWSDTMDGLEGPEATARLPEILADLHELEPLLIAMVRASATQSAARIELSEREFEHALRTLILLLCCLALCGGALIALLTWLQANMRLLQSREQTIKIQSSRFEAALNNMGQGLCMVDAAFRPVVCNQRFAAMFGVTRAFVERAGHMDDVFRAASESGAIPRALVDQIARAQSDLAPDSGQGSFLAETDDVCLSIVHQRTAEGGLLATYTDITTMRKADTLMTHMARHDALTGLANRLHFRERIERAFTEQRRQGDGFALLWLDLDHFKEVNDTLGHPIGDVLLKEVALRLSTCVRDADLVARLGGDEFAIIQFAPDQKLAAASLAERVVAAISEPFDLRGHRIAVGTSVGIALSPEDGEDADQLMRNADLALYRSKESGRGLIRFFDHDVARRVEEQRAVESELRDALGRGEITLFYQPQVNLQTLRVSGFEALMRWHSPVLGSVSPSRFIPVAESLGLIGTLGSWALMQACAAATTWPEHVRVGVNLSAVQFKYSDVVQQVAHALMATGLAAERLELEITETVLLQETARTMQALHGLRALGVRIALDDFGTGYSSPSYLLKFPFDKIKIDRCFVEDCAGASRAAAIVRSIASLAEELGLATTAEGIETPLQMEAMRAMRCTEAQGFLVSKPLPLSDVALFLREDVNEAA